MRKANIKEYSRRLFAANLDAAILLEEEFDPGCNYTWTDAADGWNIKFRLELEYRAAIGDSDSAKALSILDELEGRRSTVRNWKPETQERFSNAHVTYLKEAMSAELLPVLHVQRGNHKTGAIPCINMPMLITCPAGAACRSFCYVGKECRYKKQLTFRYNSENLALFLRDKTAFKNAVKAAIYNDSVIRWHESGDIVNADYFRIMVEIANFYPQKRFYAYTKKYSIVNDYVSKNGALPSNLTVIFSADKNLTMANHYDLPIAKIDFGDGEKIDGFKCPGKCMECAMQGVGCMNLKNGETVVFQAH